MTPDRREEWNRILRAVAQRGPLIVSEIADLARMHHEAVTYAVRVLVAEGRLICLDEMRPTRTGPAKQYDVPRSVDLNELPVDWVSRARRRSRQDEMHRQLMHALDRWGDWARRGMPPLGTKDPDRLLFWAIEAALKQMDVTHAIAITHVHASSVWVFRRIDMGECYTEALRRLKPRLIPLFGTPANALHEGQEG